MTCVAAAGVLVGCSVPGSSGAAASGNIKIGGDFPLSGLEASYGKLYEQATDLAASVVNSEHVFKGSISTSYADDAGLPAPAVTAAHQLISVDGAQVLLTGQSAPSLAVGPVGKATKTLMLNGGGGSPQLENLNSYFYNDIPLGPQTAPPMADYVTKKLGGKRWAIIYTTESVGEGLLNILKKDVPTDGGKIVSAVGISPTTSTFESEIAQIAAAKPDVLYLASTVGDIYPTILNEAAAAGMKVQVATFTGYDIPAVLADPHSNGNLFISQEQNLSPSTNAATAAFDKAWAKKYGKTQPDSLQVNYYNDVLVVALAAAKLQAAHKEINGMNLADAIRGASFSVVGGTISFTSAGTLENPSLNIVQIGTDGSEKVVQQVEGSS